MLFYRQHNNLFVNKLHKQIALNAILGAQYLSTLKANSEVGRRVEMQIQLGAALGPAKPGQVMPAYVYKKKSRRYTTNKLLTNNSGWNRERWKEGAEDAYADAKKLGGGFVSLS